MRPILAALITSANLIIYFSFLLLKIDQSIKWNWFVVFIPLFFLKFFFLTHSIVLVKKLFVYKQHGKDFSLLYYIMTILSLLTFEILLCVKLEYQPHIKYTFVFLPLWMSLIFLIIYLTKRLCSVNFIY